MRVVVTGATGNVGTAVVRRLQRERGVDAVTGVARRLQRVPGGADTTVDWWSIDVSGRDALGALTDCFRGAAAVVHLAWQVQPSHDRTVLRRTNVDGSATVARAAVRAGVPALVVASSLGAYAAGPKDRAVDEDWPVTGIQSSGYSRDKVEVERMLDVVERDHPELRVVRMRPALTFQRTAASEIARLFIGPLAPLGLLGFGRLPVVPAPPGLRVQGVHANDVADAYVRAVLSDVRGAFNLAADPVLDGASIARRFRGRSVPVPERVLRTAAALSWRARLQPVDAGWIDMGLGCPLMSTERARTALGWQPTVGALDALAELFDGMAARASDETVPLRPRPRAPLRLAAMLGGRLPGEGNPY